MTEENANNPPKDIKRDDENKTLFNYGTGDDKTFEASPDQTISPPLGSNASEIEKQVKKLSYPKSVFFIISNEFCERFNFYGSRIILILYLSRQLGYSDNDATVIFHAYTMLAYFLCVFGAIVSDSFLGKFKTILYLSLVCVTGSVLITIGAIPPLNLPARVFTMIGLVLISLGSGGIKPCITAFGGDQFKIPEQAKQSATFFSLFYLSINAGALISNLITPILREDVSCFGQKDCYSLAFGVPAVVMGISIGIASKCLIIIFIKKLYFSYFYWLSLYRLVILLLGVPLYKMKPPAGNMLVLVSKTIGYAISTKWKEQKINPREHWLDYADKKYDHSLIEDIKILMRVVVLYLPLPIFWALFNQQGSRWTLQATRMNGNMGSWDIKPDQIQMVNSFLVLAFIPLYEIAFYPLLNLVGIRRPLQKLALGGIFTGIAFVASGLVELQLEKTYPELPTSGIAQLRVYNAELCDYSITTNLAGLNFDLKSLDLYTNKTINIDAAEGLNIQFQFNSKSGANCAALPNQACLLKDKKSYYVFLDSKYPVICAEDTIAKPSHGYPLGRTLANVNPNRIITWKSSKGTIEHTEPAYLRNLTELKADTYQVLIDNIQVTTMKLEVGGIYTVLIAEESASKYRSKVITVTEPNSLSILWQLPQYIILTLGEIMFSLTGLEFSYSQAPVAMKSVLQACWQLTVAFGNVIVVVVAELSLFDSQANEFFLFAGLMFADMIVFMFVAYYYKPNNPVKYSESEPLAATETSEPNGIDNVAHTVDE